MRRTAVLALAAAAVVHAAVVERVPKIQETKEDPAKPVLTNVVTTWIDMLNSAIQQGTGAQVSNHHHARNIGLMCEAILGAIKAAPKLDADVVASYAAQQMIGQWFPWYQSKNLDPLLNAYAGYPKVAAYPKIDAVKAAVDPVVSKILKREVDSGIVNWVQRDFAPSTIGASKADLEKYQGKYQLTDSAYVNATKGTTTVTVPWQQRGHFGTVNSFFGPLDKLAEGLGPRELSSNQYKEDIEEIQAFGSADCSKKSKFNCETPKFWLHDWSQLPTTFIDLARARAKADMSVEETAKLFAALGEGIFEATNVGYGMKWGKITGTRAAWRPVTAIHSGDTFGHAADTTWKPQLGTPEHPEYPSGHCAHVGAAVHALRLFFGTDDANGAIVKSDYCEHNTNTCDLANRKYATFSDIEEDVTDSRVFGGVHYRHSCWDGTELGHRAMEASFAHFFGEGKFKNVDSLPHWTMSGVAPAATSKSKSTPSKKGSIKSTTVEKKVKAKKEKKN